MTKISVSAVIPAYNSAETIQTCLDSVANQTLPPSQILVVDDHSKDNTVKKIQQWNQQHDNTAKIIVLAKNGGPAAARNTGIQEAKCEWIAFLDADDAWLPWRLELQSGILQKHTSATLLCGKTIDLQDPLDEEHKPPLSTEVKPIKLQTLLSHNPVATSTVLAKRNAIIQCGAFDTNFRGPEDYDLWLRLVATGECLQMDVALSRYRTTVGSLSMDDRSFLPEVLRVLAKAFAKDGALATYRAYYSLAKAEQYTAASWMAYNRGDRERAITLLFRSWMQSIAPIEKEKTDPLQRLKLLLRYAVQPPKDRQINSKAQFN